MSIIRTEQPVRRGGGLRRTNGHQADQISADAAGCGSWAPPADSIDMAEDRERFDELLEELHIKPSPGLHRHDRRKRRFGWPTGSGLSGAAASLLRAGRPEHDHRLHRRRRAGIHGDHPVRQNIENPVLVDKYLMGTELEVDAICDGEDVLIPGIMEHVERAGIHSGDSIAVYPAWNLDDRQRGADRGLHPRRSGGVPGNQGPDQHPVSDLSRVKLYVIEVNPRSSRTIPYISKVTGVPMVDLATRAMLGEKLSRHGLWHRPVHRPPPMWR